MEECIQENSILKKVGEAWVTIPHEVQEVKESGALAGLSDKAKRIYNDLQNGEELSSSDLSYLVYNFELDDQREVGENRRWQRGVTSIIELGGKHYAINWEEGLTENQENDFWEQPVEATKHEYEKVVTITEWKPVGKEREEEKDGRNHYRVYESLEDAKAKKPSFEKCKVQIVRDKSKDELKELAEFACQLMDSPIYYNNEDKLLEDFFKYKQEREARQDLKEKDGDDLEL